MHRPAAEAPQVRRRVVKVPQAVQPSAWESYARRREQFYATRSRPRAELQVAQRSLAQTGRQAAGGQVPMTRRSLPKMRNSPVPVRRGQQRRAGFFWKVLGIFALLALLGLGLGYALTGPTFRVEQVHVIGTHNAGLVQHIQHMGMQGQSMFLIDVAALTARIDMLPWIASASLQKQWPNQLVVAVTERAPVLLWKTKYGTYSVDGQGFVIAPASETPGADRLMTVIDMSTYKSGGKATAALIRPGVHLNEANVAFAMQVFKTLPGLTGMTDFTLLYVDAMPATAGGEQGALGGDGSYVVESKAGWIAYLGGPDDPNPLANRLIELQRILALAQQQQLNLATVDLRYGLRPVYTLKS